MRLGKGSSGCPADAATPTLDGLIDLGAAVDIARPGGRKRRRRAPRPSIVVGEGVSMPMPMPMGIRFSLLPDKGAINLV
jgi:hypothetical protein